MTNRQAEAVGTAVSTDEPKLTPKETIQRYLCGPGDYRVKLLGLADTACLALIEARIKKFKSKAKFEDYLNAEEGGLASLKETIVNRQNGPDGETYTAAMHLGGKLVGRYVRLRREMSQQEGVKNQQAAIQIMLDDLSDPYETNEGPERMNLLLAGAERVSERFVANLELCRSDETAQPELA